MTYPDAYCVRCKSHTDTMAKHTVILSNKRRAVKGVCPVCATQTYRLMPEKKDKARAKESAPLSLLPSHLRSNWEAASTRVAQAEIPVYQSRLDHLSRVEIVRDNLAQRIWNYGMLMTIFGLSIACGFMICVVLFKT